MTGFWYCVLYLAALGIAAHFIGEALPRGVFSPDRFPFRTYKWEKDGQFYKKLGIRRWKDRVPDMSRFVRSMQPKRLEKGGVNVAEMEALITETCVAETVHAVLILLSPVVLFLWPCAWGTALWLFDVLLLNLPYILIQRYNRPKLVRTCRRMQNRS